MDIIPWVNIVLHYIMPVVVVVDWTIDPPRSRLKFRQALLWLTFPLAYLAYTLIRGSLVHWYPYPFFDADIVGHRSVAIYAIAISTFTFFVAIIVFVAGNALRRRLGTGLGESSG